MARAPTGAIPPAPAAGPPHAPARWPRPRRSPPRGEARYRGLPVHRRGAGRLGTGSCPGLDPAALGGSADVGLGRDRDLGRERTVAARRRRRTRCRAPPARPGWAT